MSMTVNTALEIAEIFAAYSVITLLLPHIVIGKSVQFKNKYERFLLYTICGNFYVMNLVYLLELLHISHKITLIAGTVIPLAFIKIKLEKIPFGEKVSRRWEWLRKFAGGQLKVKAYRDRGKEERAARNKKLFKAASKLVFSNIPEVLLILGIVASTFYTFGTNLLTEFGYKLSDIVVHNSWINQLGENDIFTRGIYPYGFHNMLYYIHEVFGIDTYVLLRLMNLIIITWAALLLLCFLELLCKSRFIPFLGVYAYVLIDFLESAGYIRFCGPLPQEYSIIFVLPTVYCAFAYFREQRREDNGCAARRSYKYLGGYIFSFSMTLSTHFYSTIATGIFIVAIAIGFIVWFIRWEYFKKLALSSILAVVIAVLPMGVAYATGTELEGSLKWAINVMTGAPIVAGDEQIVIEPDDHEPLFEYNQRVLHDVFGVENSTSQAFVATIRQELDVTLINTNHFWIYVLMLSFPLTVILGIFYMLTKTGDKIYGAVLVSNGLNMIFMTMLLCAYDFRLPQLMDQSRTCVFFPYTMCGGLALLIDAVLNLICSRFYKRHLLNIVSFAIVVAALTASLMTGYIRKPIEVQGFESNDAILCLTRIIRDCKDNTWTICAAIDEGRMVYEHGYFYELIDLLRGMEFVGSSGWVRIPTETVFFFVEKYPIDYNPVTYPMSGTSISKEYAEMPLPLGNSRSVYQAQNRWICMSRYYYWAETFMSLYPNEMTVYYESDKFICYRVEQNTYRLFNFAIDYGYNIPDDLRIGGE